MSVINVDLDKYQKKYDLFIVIKDFYKIGSAVMGYDMEHEQKYRELLLKCSLLAKSPLQVVRVGGPMALYGYGEYGPYTVYDSEFDLINICLSGECPGK